MFSPESKQKKTRSENQQLLNTEEVKLRRSTRLYIVCFLFFLTITGLLVFRPWSDSYEGEETPVVEITQDPKIWTIYEAYKLSRHWIDNDDNSFHFLAGYMGDHSTNNGSPIIKGIHMIVSFKEKNTFRLKILDNQDTRWEIPESSPFPHFPSNNSITY